VSLIKEGKTNIKYLLIAALVAAVAGVFIFWFSWQENYINLPYYPRGMKYCESKNDCVPVGCGCSCSGCGGFSYEDVINKKFFDQWYQQHNCEPPRICLMVCCPQTTIVCENNRCAAETKKE